MADGSTVEFFKIDGGAHTWPNAPFTIGITNRDMDASVEIWRFFSQYTTTSLLSTQNAQMEAIQIYPNPTQDMLKIQSNQLIDAIRITDLSGKEIYRNIGYQDQINLTAFNAGVYFINIHSGTQVYTEKFIIQ